MSTIEIISYIANAILIIIGFFLWNEQKKQKETIKSQIKVWDNTLNGFRKSLVSCWHKADTKSFSTVQDVGFALFSLIPSLEGISTSLYQERFFSDKEIKEALEKQRQEKEKTKLPSIETHSQN